MIKLITILTRKPGMTKEEFMDLWANEHTTIATSVPGIRRYVISVITQEVGRADVPSPDYPVDGIAELYFDNIESMKKVMASAELKRWRAHGATFLGTVKGFLCDEKVVIAN